ISPPLLEWYYKNDDLGDPHVSENHIRCFQWATTTEIRAMEKFTFDINQALQKLLHQVGLTLVDLKIEFGRDKEGQVILADEITPDTCRLWDINSGTKFDKDRFRFSLGDLMEGYREVWNRLSPALKPFIEFDPLEAKN